MVLFSWWQSLVQTAYPKREKTKPRRRERLPRKLRYAAQVELLEDRLVPSSTPLFLNEGTVAAPVNTITAGRSQIVPVFIDVGTLSGGAGGIGAGTFYLQYDPAALSTTGTFGTDLKLGSIFTGLTGSYTLSTAVGTNASTGVLGVSLKHAANTPFYTGTGPGHVVEVDFTVATATAVGDTTLVDLLPKVITGTGSKATNILDKTIISQYTITPAPTNYLTSNPGAVLTQPTNSLDPTPAGLTPTDSDTADATIQIVPVPPTVSPVTTPDTYSMAPNDGVNFPPTMTVTAANGVLANDTDTNSPMFAVLASGPASGAALTLNSDGSFVYTPNAGFIGIDTFAYRAVDSLSNGQSAATTVTIQVGGLLSIPENLTLDAGSVTTVVVPVNIANPDPANSGGLVSLTVGINYDANKFTVANADVAEGSVLNNAGWVTFAADANTPGRIDFNAVGPAITTTAGGDIADITFHLAPAASNGPSVVNLAASGTALFVNGTGSPVQLPFAVAPADNASTTVPGANGLDGLITISGISATNTATTVNTSNAAPTYGTSVMLTATVAPASGTTAPTQGSVEFFINGSTPLGAGTFAGTDASNDAIFTFPTGATQLQVDGGLAQPISATYTAGAGFNGSSSTNPVSETVAPFTLTVSGITASNKVYDQTTAATLNPSGATLTGVFSGDTVNLVTGSESGAFSDANAGTGKTVTVSGLTLSGAQGGNYALPVPQETTTANITPLGLTVTGITTNNKVYDGTASASLNSSGETLNGVLSGDSVSLTGAAVGTFASKDVANGISVAVSGLSLAGAQAGNYSLPTPQETTTANITPKTLSVTGITANNKVYDGTTAATVNTGGATLVGVVPGDTVGLASGTGTSTITQWTFNTTVAPPDNSPTPTTGTGTATILNMNTFNGNTAANADVLLQAGTANPSFSEYLWRIRGTPNNGWFNGAPQYSQGIELDASTGGFQHVKFSFDWYDTASGIRDLQFQYNLNTGNAAGWTNFGGTSPTGTYIGLPDDYYNAPGSPTITVDLSSVAGASNDPTFGIRLVSAYDSTGNLPGQYAGATLSGGTTQAYDNGSGNWRFANLTFGGTPLSGATGTFDTKDVGTGKTVTVSGLSLTGAQAADYTLPTPQATTTANITPLGLTVNGITAANKTYDGGTTATLNTSGASLGGVLSGDTVTLTGTAVGTFAGKDVGTGIAVTVSGLSLGGAQANDYSLPTPQATTSANITPKTLSVTGITAANKVYDGTTAAAINTSGATLVGVVAGDSVSLGTGSTSGTITQWSFSAVANPPFNSPSPSTGAGTAITLGMTNTYNGGNTANDDVLNTAGTANSSFNEFTWRIRGTAHNGWATHAAGAPQYSQGVELDASTVGFQNIQFAFDWYSTTQGIRDLQFQYNTNTGNAAGWTNFGGTSPTGTYIATPNDFYNAPGSPTITVDLSSIAGAANDPSFGIRLVSAFDSTGHVPNDYASATLAGGQTVIYNNNSGNWRFANLTFSGTALASSPTGSFADKNVGTGKTVTVSGLSLTGPQAFDYALPTPQATTTANITPLAITGSITAANKVYDATTSATITSRTLTGVISGDNVSYVGGTATFADKNVGTGKTVTATGLSLSGADAGNYTVNTTATTMASITPASLTVTATGQDRGFDGTTTATVTLSDNRVAGDVFTDSYASATFANAGPGSNIPITVTGISISGADAANYTLSSTTATTSATIFPAHTLTVTGITASDKVYDGMLTATLNVSGATLVGVQSGDSVTLSTAGAAGQFATKNVGTSIQVTISGLTISGTDASKYTLVQPTTTANITALAITGSVTAADKVYDGTTAATITSRTLSGVVSGDTVSYVGGTATFSDKNVGTGKTVTATGLSLSGPDAGNYTVNTTATTTASITALAITGSITAANKVYDGTTTATITSRTLTGVISGDNVSYVGGTANFSDPNVGTGKTVTATGLSLSGPDAGNYTVNTTATTTANITAASVTAVAVNWGSQSLAVQTQLDGLRILPAGRANDVPWVNTSGFAITLSDPETLTAGNVSATGVIGGNYGPVTISGFGTAYTITLHKVISKGDRVTITIGNAGIATYARRLDVLPGDVNDDGVVNTTDGLLILANQTSGHAYSPFRDMNGDGSVNMTDFTLYRPYIGTVLATIPTAQIAADGEGHGATFLLSQGELAPVFQQAISIWAARLPAQEAALLHEIHAQVVMLPAGYLGTAAIGGDTIYISADAAGHGWTTSPTRGDSREDLLTVVLHELGHTLGLSDLNPTQFANDLMTETLASGVRRLPSAMDVAAVTALHASVGSGNGLTTNLISSNLGAIAGAAFSTPVPFTQVPYSVWTPPLPDLASARGVRRDSSNVFGDAELP